LSQREHVPSSYRRCISSRETYSACFSHIKATVTFTSVSIPTQVVLGSPYLSSGAAALSDDTFGSVSDGTVKLQDFGLQYTRVNKNEHMLQV
jgi:hypothetical protein